MRTFSDNECTVFLIIKIRKTSPKTAQNPSFEKTATVHFRNGQIMHNNQIGYLARRVYIYLNPPVFKGFSEGAVQGLEA